MRMMTHLMMLTRVGMAVNLRIMAALTVRWLTALLRTSDEGSSDPAVGVAVRIRLRTVHSYGTAGGGRAEVGAVRRDSGIAICTVCSLFLMAFSLC